MGWFLALCKKHKLLPMTIKEYITCVNDLLDLMENGQDVSTLVDRLRDFFKEYRENGFSDVRQWFYFTTSSSHEIEGLTTRWDENSILCVSAQNERDARVQVLNRFGGEWDECFTSLAGFKEEINLIPL